MSAWVTTHEGDLISEAVYIPLFRGTIDECRAWLSKFNVWLEAFPNQG